MGRLENKSVLITGAARGQGATEAVLFAKEGAKVVIGDILQEEGRKIANEITENGGQATFVHLNVVREMDWINAINETVTTYGKLDILINNAAIYSRNGVETTTEEEWNDIMNINVKGPFLGSRLAIPFMKSGGGSIVNISSVGGLVGSPLGAAAYSASKGAIRLLTKSIAIQYAKNNIRCNSVHPGTIDTDMIKDAMDDPILYEDRRKRIPMLKIGSVDDVAYGVLYLASDESSFVTGAELVIDGGSTAR